MSTSDRKILARRLLVAGATEADFAPPGFVGLPERTPHLAADLALQFPVGLTPTPRPLEHPPSSTNALPIADALIITWTIAELNALTDVFTPGFGRRSWYFYNRNFETLFAPRIRPGAPSHTSRRLGSWFPVSLGNKSIICFKSELHLNQDGIATGVGTATLPVLDMLRQIVEEVQPKVILTIGTSGAVRSEDGLGDVIVSRAAKFRLSDEFRNEEFNGKTYVSSWDIPRRRVAEAEALMQGMKSRIQEPSFGPPTKRYAFDGPVIPSVPPNEPSIKFDGDSFRAFHPVLTTDFFEFGTSANQLDSEGCAVEMGDAVVGLLCESVPDPPLWAIIRNVSDPVINADLPTQPRNLDMQAHWAVWYYEAFGYWTSVNGALAAWAILGAGNTSFDE